MLDVDNIRIDGGTQARSELNEAVVQQYADAISAGETFPPIITFFDGTDHWIADGFHRLFAHKKLELVEIDAEIRSGTRRDAVLFSVGANRRHGLPASNADKRKAVQTLLDDAEWAQWSDREIARQCGVSAPFVGGARKAICKPFTDTSRTVERNGKTYEQQTSSIGRTPIPTPTEQRIKQICAEERRNVEAEDKQSRQDSASWKADAPEDEGPSAAEVAASEAAEAPEPTPDQNAPDNYTELDAARDQISELQSALVVANMGDVDEEGRQQAAEFIANLQAEIKTLIASLAAAYLSRDTYMEENAQLKKQCQMQRREIDRLKTGK